MYSVWLTVDVRNNTSHRLLESRAKLPSELEVFALSGAWEAAQAVLALAFGGYLFLTLGQAVTSTMSGSSLVDFRFWGILYILTAIVLGAVLVYGFAVSVLKA